MEHSPVPHSLRFGIFEVDLQAGELRKGGLKIRLQEQPFQVLGILLERSGKVVTREELQKTLWPQDTFVDFDHGVNTAINKIRQALGDSAENPRFVETVARRGYRFIAPVEIVGAHENAAPVTPVGASPDAGDDRRTEDAARRAALQRRFVAATVALALVAVAVLLALNVAGLRDRLVRQGATLPKIESLAVLPLENLSRDPEQEYFADGMTDELITSLAKIGSLRVISRNSVMQYKGQRKPTPQIAKELNVDAVVEGTVLRAGNRVRISAQLIQANPEKHLWAESYERDLRDVLALQGEIARAVADQIRIELTAQERTRLSSSRPVNPESYQLYLMGRYHAGKATVEGFMKGIEYFQQAIEKDPGNALAYAGVAHCYAYLGGGFGHLPTKEASSKARAAALRALEIDDTLAEAHSSLAVIRWQHDWDWSSAEREFKRAVELNPNSAVVHNEYMGYLASVGRLDQSIAEGRLAQQLDPFGPRVVGDIGWAYMINRHYDEALAYLQKALELDPNLPWVRVNLVMTYVLLGRQTQALAESEKLEQYAYSAEHTMEASDLGYGYAVMGKRPEAQRILAHLKKLAKTRYVDASRIALVHAGLGEKDQAFEWLQRAYVEHSGSVWGLKVNPRWDPIRSDPRFQDLLRRMNFPP
jgi:TolB-like protein/DNA-binding winged helix-turn-helix (wHTH) protein/Tfp pilus assembly protein PilF